MIYNYNIVADMKCVAAPHISSLDVLRPHCALTVHKRKLSLYDNLLIGLWSDWWSTRLVHLKHIWVSYRVSEMYRLNGEYNRWRCDCERKYSKIEQFCDFFPKLPLFSGHSLPIMYNIPLNIHPTHQYKAYFLVFFSCSISCPPLRLYPLSSFPLGCSAVIIWFSLHINSIILISVCNYVVWQGQW